LLSRRQINFLGRVLAIIFTLYKVEWKEKERKAFSILELFLVCKNIDAGTIQMNRLMLYYLDYVYDRVVFGDVNGSNHHVYPGRPHITLTYTQPVDG